MVELRHFPIYAHTGTLVVKLGLVWEEKVKPTFSMISFPSSDVALMKPMIDKMHWQCDLEI